MVRDMYVCLYRLYVHVYAYKHKNTANNSDLKVTGAFAFYYAVCNMETVQDKLHSKCSQL